MQEFCKPHQALLCSQYDARQATARYVSVLQALFVKSAQIAFLALPPPPWFQHMTQPERCFHRTVQAHTRPHRQQIFDAYSNVLEYFQDDPCDEVSLVSLLLLVHLSFLGLCSATDDEGLRP